MLKLRQKHLEMADKLGDKFYARSQEDVLPPGATVRDVFRMFRKILTLAF